MGTLFEYSFKHTTEKHIFLDNWKKLNMEWVLDVKELVLILLGGIPLEPQNHVTYIFLFLKFLSIRDTY